MHQEAVTSYRKFLKIYKDSKWINNAKFGLGFALENVGNHEEAIKESDKLIATESAEVDWIVRCHFQIGMSLQHAKLFIKINPLAKWKRNLLHPA